jgi:hypothetical protein
MLYLTFQSFDLERTWWRLFQKRVVYTIFDFPIFRPWAYLMKVIPETCRYAQGRKIGKSNIVYTTHFWNNLHQVRSRSKDWKVKYSIHDILYLTFQSLDFERTWWRLFQKRVMYTIFDFPIFRFWAYLMKVIPETCRVYYNVSGITFIRYAQNLKIGKSNIVYTTRFWNNLHQVRSRSKDWKVKYSFDFPIFRFWAYQMKVIPKTCRVYYIWLSNL